MGQGRFRAVQGFATPKGAIVAWGPVLLLALLAVWILSPMLFASQLEGYSANLSSLALNFGPEAAARVVPGMELQGEYLYRTRIGVILLLAVLGALTGQVGAVAFHALMVAGVLLFCAASVAIVRRFVAGPVWVAPAALLLIPGAIDSAFFLNDNVISAGIALAGLALVAWSRATVAYFIAGLALGFAIMCRTDAVFVAPMIAAMCWLTTERLRDLARPAFAAIAGVALALGLVTLGTGVSLLEAREIGARFTLPVFASTMLYLPFGFLGLPGLILLALGLWRASRSRPGLRFWLSFGLYPIATIVFFASHTSLQIRHFYPLLVPLVAVHVGNGLMLLSDWTARGGLARGAGLALIGALAASMALPPGLTIGPLVPQTAYRLLDGPRHPVLGRLWMPLLWLRWQNAQNTSTGRAADLVESLADTQRTTILATHYDDIAYLTLALFERGYRTVPVADLWPGCRDTAVVVFQRADAQVILVRGDNQYHMMPLGTRQTAAFFVHNALGCAPLRQSDRFVLTMMGRPDRVDGLNRPLSEPLSGIHAGLNGRFADPAGLSADLTPDWANLLSNPFVIRPSRQTTFPRFIVPVFHAIALSRDEIAAIGAAAEKLAPAGFGAADFRAIYQGTGAAR